SRGLDLVELRLAVADELFLFLELELLGALERAGLLTLLTLGIEHGAQLVEVLVELLDAARDGIEPALESPELTILFLKLVERSDLRIHGVTRGEGTVGPPGLEPGTSRL